MTEFYKQIVRELKVLLQPNESIISAWEGGSAATGFLDEYSDLDLALIVKDDAIEETFELIEDYLDDRYGIKNKFRMPEPSWHGHSQIFCILENAPEFFYVDLLIEKESAENRFTESDRHGNSIIWFDKKNLIDSTPTPQDVVNEKCKHSYLLMKQYIPFTIIDIKKQIKRGNSIDALAIYNGFMNRFIMLLNIKYRPSKFDFGLRYTYRDLPENEVGFLESVMFVENLDDLQKKFSKVERKIKELLDVLDKDFI